MNPHGSTSLTAPLADRIVAATGAVPGVAGLAGGIAGAIGTYLPGRRVLGVRTGPTDSVEVHIIAEYGCDVCSVAEAVRGVVRSIMDGPVDVYIDDIVTAGAPVHALRAEDGMQSP